MNFSINDQELQEKTKNDKIIILVDGENIEYELKRK
tara:strand:- start:1322 stop:1429 length:108 start_codon:yes stop_codon:yes gene_type:complete